MTTRRQRGTASAVMAVLGLVLAGTAAEADTARGLPAVVDLGTLPGGSHSFPNGVDEHGTVAGTADTAAGHEHAVRWDPGGRITDLGTAAGFPHSFAQAINDRGVIIGFAAADEQRSVRALRWDPSGRMTDLGALPGDTDSKPFGVNDNGTVVGISGSSGAFRAVRWDAGGRITDLGTLGGDESWALAINDEGTAVGYARTAEGVWHATKWDRAGRITDLAPTGGNTEAFDINDHGVVSGRSGGSDGAWWDRSGRMTVLSPGGAQIAGISHRGAITATDFTATPARAMQWTRDGVTSVLDVLPGQEDNWSIANDTNDRGTAVGVSGFTAVKWDVRGRVTALGDLGGGNSRAVHVNDAGTVVGDAYDPVTGNFHAVLWPAG